MNRLTWDQYGLNLAHAAATRSEDPYHQVGAVLMRPNHSVASVGYNGAAPGINIDWSDRDARRAHVIHAEMNALRYVQAGEVSTLICTMMPCQACILVLAAYGVTRIVYSEELDPQVYDTPTIRQVANVLGVELVKERG